VDNRTSELFNEQSNINKGLSSRISNLDENITNSQKDTINYIQKLNNDTKDIHLKINDNEKLILQAQEESMKAIQNHNNILHELTLQNKNIANEFLNVAQETANDPQKFKILSVALAKSMECVNVLSDKVAFLEDLLDKIQVKVTEIDSKRSFNLVRNLASPRASSSRSTTTNNETNINIIKNDDNTEI
jgi:hypothetical protein